jgi:hypothetical protein
VKRLALLCLAAMALAGCGGEGAKPGKTVARSGGGPKPARVLATVGLTKITQRQVAALAAYSRARAVEEGEVLPRPGTALYRAVRQKAIDTLVTLAEYEQKAASLGIHFDRQAILERAKSIENEGTNKDTKQVEGAKQLLARLGLYREALFTYVTRNVVVTKADVHAYFEKNRRFYENFPAAKKTIRDQVLAVKRNNVGNAFFAKLPGEFKVVYKR